MYNFLIALLFAFSTTPWFPVISVEDIEQVHPIINVEDTLKEKLSLYNGKLWTNTYYKIKGDPYFLSGQYLPGSVTFNGKVFPDLRLKYDIFNDEIILWIDPQTIIILNKEMIDSVNIDYLGKSYKVINLGDDSASVIKGLVNICYDGETTLFVKYKKMIDPLAVENRYDIFIQTHRLYVKRDDKIFLVSGKRDLLKILADKLVEVKSFIKTQRLSVMRKDPESFIPVLKYYDSLKQ